jgi:hypothetical protein
MYKLKKIGKLFTSKFVGTESWSYEKRIYRAAVSQWLRNRKLAGQHSNEIIPSTVRTPGLTREAMCVQRNSEARSCNHCCNGKSVNITLFSLRYPACNAHAPYCDLWPVRLCYIFTHYLVNSTIFGEKSY